MENVNWIEEAKSIWTMDGGIKLQTGEPLSKIFEIETQLNFKFPLDFVIFYQKINGFKDFDWNENMFTLWSLERILKEYQEANNLDFIGFCDYLIQTCTIGFNKHNDHIYKYIYDEPEFVVNTFEETIALFNTNYCILY